MLYLILDIAILILYISGIIALSAMIITQKKRVRLFATLIATTAIVVFIFELPTLKEIVTVVVVYAVIVYVSFRNKVKVVKGTFLSSSDEHLGNGWWIWRPEKAPN